MTPSIHAVDSVAFSVRLASEFEVPFVKHPWSSIRGEAKVTTKRLSPFPGVLMASPSSLSPESPFVCLRALHRHLPPPCIQSSSQSKQTIRVNFEGVFPPKGTPKVVSPTAALQKAAASVATVRPGRCTNAR